MLKFWGWKIMILEIEWNIFWRVVIILALLGHVLVRDLINISAYVCLWTSSVDWEERRPLVTGLLIYSQVVLQRYLYLWMGSRLGSSHVPQWIRTESSCISIHYYYAFTIQFIHFPPKFGAHLRINSFEKCLK